MATKFLDKTGLSYFWSKIKAWCNAIFAPIVHTHTSYAVKHSYTVAANAAKNWYRIANTSTQQLDTSKPIHAQFILTAYNTSYTADYYERWFVNVGVFGRTANIVIFGATSVPFSQARVLYENTVADIDANDRPAIDIYLNYVLPNGTTKIEIEEVYNNGGWTFLADGQLAASTVPSGFESVACSVRNNGVERSTYADYVFYLNRQVNNITAAFTLADSYLYRSRTLNCTGTFTITIPSINSGYMWCVIKNKNTSSGVITLHPSTTSVLIDGSNADITLQPMEYVCIHSAGANNYSLIADGRWKSQKADKATTLEGYGITDAKIVNGTITLGSNSITPLTSVPSHNQASNTIIAMTGYSKPNSSSAITTSDTLNSAIGKLEKGLENADTTNAVLKNISNQVTVKEFLFRDVDNDALRIGGGSGRAKGANILLYGKDNENSGRVDFQAYDGTNYSTLKFEPTETRPVFYWLNGYGSGSEQIAYLTDLSGYVPSTRTINSKALSSNISLTASDVGAAASSHNQASNTINLLTGYSKPSSGSAITVSDSLNQALGKLEYKIDNISSIKNVTNITIDYSTETISDNDSTNIELIEDVSSETLQQISTIFSNDSVSGYSNKYFIYDGTTLLLYSDPAPTLWDTRVSVEINKYSDHWTIKAEPIVKSISYNQYGVNYHDMPFGLNTIDVTSDDSPFLVRIIYNSDGSNVSFSSYTIYKKDSTVKNITKLLVTKSDNTSSYLELPYIGATELLPSTPGLVPCATANQRDKVLTGKGTWDSVNSLIDDNNYVHKTGDETISGVKTFIGNMRLSDETDSQYGMIIRNPDFTRGVIPEAGVWTGIYFCDANNVQWGIDGTASSHGRLSAIEGIVSPEGWTETRITTYKNENPSTARAELKVGYNYEEGIAYAKAPSTSVDRTNGEDIITRNYLENYYVYKKRTDANLTLVGRPWPYTHLENENKSFNSFIEIGRYQLRMKGNDAGAPGGLGSTDYRSGTLIVDVNGGAVNVSSSPNVFQTFKMWGYSTNRIFFRNGYRNTATSITWGSWAEVQKVSSSSDARLKFDINNVSDKLLDVWEKISFSQFRFKDSKLKLCVGVIAQDILSASDELGLNIDDYNLVDTETYYLEDSSEEVSRYALRYIDLLCIEAAYQRRKNKILENRISDLEKQVSNMLQILQSLKGAN